MDTIKGNDIECVSISINDDYGNPILINSLNDYHIYVYTLNGATKQLYFTYRKEPVGNDKEIILIDDYTIGFIVDRVQTLKLPIGKVYAEIQIKLTSDNNYISSLKKIGMDDFCFANIIDSANPKAML